MDKLGAFLPSTTMLRSLTSRRALCALSAATALFLTFLYLTRDLLTVTTSPLTRSPPTLRPIPLRTTTANTIAAFKIAVFSDLHFGEEEATWGPEQDRRTLALMREVLAAEAPDLVVLNGDLVTGENTVRENATAYVDMLVAPMVEAGVPWASTYGNHDSQFNLSREGIFDAEAKYELCRTWRADEALPGVTNYYLPLVSEVEGPRAVLWFFDSRGGKVYQGGSGGGEEEEIPGWVPPTTASWFLNTQSHLARLHPRLLPSLAFVHIPTRDYLPMQSLVEPHLLPGQNYDDPAAAQSDADSAPSHPASSFADALLAAEGLHSVHAGHDHGNDWCAPPTNIEGVRPFLCFGRQSGFGGYGDWERGARILQLEFYGYGEGEWGRGRGMEVETWIRLEGGRVVGRVGLNDTYGGDEYPVDD